MGTQLVPLELVLPQGWEREREVEGEERKPQHNIQVKAGQQRLHRGNDQKEQLCGIDGEGDVLVQVLVARCPIGPAFLYCGQECIRRTLLASSPRSRRRIRPLSYEEERSLDCFQPAVHIFLRRATYSIRSLLLNELEFLRASA
jgi:hypothetical protein